MIRFDLSFTVAAAEYGLGDVQIAAHFVLPPPERLGPSAAVLFCLPGGSMTKGYYDLDANGDRSFSFAEAMAEQGLATVAIDHPGVGDSTRPDDGYLLHPDTVAAIDHAALLQIMDALRSGVGGYPPIPSFRAVGVGHSMGGMLTGVLQARFELYDAVAILGAGPYGLLSHLIEELKPLADSPAAARSEIAPRLRAAGIAPYRMLGGNGEARSGIFHGGDRTGVEAMRRVRAELILVCGLFSMIPASWAPDAAAIRAPLFLAFGDDDICPNPFATPQLFPRATDQTLLVLEGTGHSHFIFPSRTRLFNRLAAWARCAVAANE